MATTPVYGLTIPNPTGADAPAGHTQIGALASDLETKALELRGTLAARPAASTAGDGREYYATDTKQKFKSNGAVWKEITTDLAAAWHTLFGGATIRQGPNSYAETSAISAPVTFGGGAGGNEVSYAGWYFDPADHALPNKTLKLRLRAWMIVAASAGTPVLTVRLKDVNQAAAGGASSPSGSGYLSTLATVTLNILTTDFGDLKQGVSSEINAPAVPTLLDVTTALSANIGSQTMAFAVQWRNV